MNTIDLTGTWYGTIIYGKGYRNMIGKELFFSADIIQNGDEIAAVAKDIGGEGASPDPANILGKFKDNKIEFYKQL
jgi:hypothetical protein